MIGIMWGAHKENGVWIGSRAMRRWKWRDHDCLFIAVGRLRLRLMKPTWMVR